MSKKPRLVKTQLEVVLAEAQQPEGHKPTYESDSIIPLTAQGHLLLIRPTVNDQLGS